MTNIISSFRVTGVCPFNRSVIKIYTENDDESDFTSFRRNDLAQRTGLAYVPLYTPTRGQSSSVQGVQKSISSTPYCEESCIVSPLHEGSFLDSSSFEPSRMDVSVPNPRKPARDLRATSVPVQMESSISKFLILPIPPSKMPTKRGKAAGTVLTSKECLIQIQDRERKKQEELLQKEEQKRLREEKARQKKLDQEMAKLETKQMKLQQKKPGKLINYCNSNTVQTFEENTLNTRTTMQEH